MKAGLRRCRNRDTQIRIGHEKANRSSDAWNRQSSALGKHGGQMQSAALIQQDAVANLLHRLVRLALRPHATPFELSHFKGNEHFAALRELNIRGLPAGHMNLW